MPKKNSGAVYALTSDQLISIVETSRTISEICTKIGILSQGGSKRILLRRLEELSISIDHIPRGLNNNLGILGRSGVKPIELTEVLTENSSYSRHVLKKRLLNNGILENKCSLCPQGTMWNSKTLILHLDHENGVRNDNRIENLRILCPNCHSQTETFAGRNARKKS